MKKLLSTGLLVAVFMTGGAASGCNTSAEDNLPMSAPKEDRIGTVRFDSLYDGYSAFVVHAQIYRGQGSGSKAHWVGVGGSSSAYVNAKPNGSPGGVKILGGVEGTRPGPFPFHTTITGVPFAFPIYVEPGIALEIEAEFVTLVDNGWLFRCWITDRLGVTIVGSEDQRTGEGMTDTVVNCHTIVIG